MAVERQDISQVTVKTALVQMNEFAWMRLFPAGRRMTAPHLSVSLQDKQVCQSEVSHQRGGGSDLRDVSTRLYVVLCILSVCTYGSVDVQISADPNEVSGHRPPLRTEYTV